MKFFLFTILALVVAPACVPAETPSAPAHLLEARALLRDLDLAATNYEHGPPQVTWDAPRECHTDCSGFLDALFMHTYHFDREGLKRWLDSRRPTAKRYHDAILQQRGFTQLQHIADLRPGDILAVKYLTRTDNTGHVMLADSTAQRRTATEPLVEGTQQWEVTVIDSSKSGHGITDTRHKLGPEGKDHDGLGRGILRVYTTEDGSITGFAWSTLKASSFAAPDSEHLVMGRFVPGFQP